MSEIKKIRIQDILGNSELIKIFNHVILGLTIFAKLGSDLCFIKSVLVLFTALSCFG